MAKILDERMELGRGGYVGTNEVAKFLGISRPTMYRLMNAGKLRYTTIGGLRRISRDDVHELIESNMTGAGA